MRTNARNQSGHMLATMLVVVFCSGILLHALLEGQLRSAQLIHRDTRNLQAFYLAESAVEHSLSLLRKGESGIVELTEFGSGRYEAQVEVLPDDRGVALVGSGMMDMLRGEVLTRQIQAIAVKTPEEGWKITDRVE